MDSTIVIAVVGIIGAIVGIVGTYLVQKTTLERQRRWALEDDERNRESQREAEQRKIKRDLLSKRLDVLEEAVKLMISDTSRTLGIELGFPILSDKAAAQKRQERVEDVADEAEATVLALDSEDLQKNWRAVASAYWSQLETGTVGDKLWNEAQKAYVDIVKLADEMRAQL